MHFKIQDITKSVKQKICGRIRLQVHFIQIGFFIT